MKLFKSDSQPKIKTGFTVPENYFENFRAGMLQQIHSETKVISLRQNRESWWYAAAAVLILALSIPAINVFSTATGQTDIAMLDRYFADAELSEDQLIELLEAEDIDEISIDYGLDDAAIEDVLQTRPIENYILN